MSQQPNNLTSLIFKGAVKGDIGKLSLDGNMLRVLLALDGEKNLGTIARDLGIDLARLKSIIQGLYRQRLITKVEKSIRAIDADFFEFLTNTLCRAVGPIAPILIEDEIMEFGTEPGAIPSDQAAELVELLARQIPRDEKRVEFQKAMVEMIRSKGY